MDSRLIGFFFTAQGLSSLCSGTVASRLIPRLGPLGYTAVANLCAATSMLLKGVAKSPAWVFASLVPYTVGPMGVRSAAVNALHTAEATKHGLQMGELTAARANFFTLLKMSVPLLYARLYKLRRSLPFLFAAGLIAMSQLLMLVVGNRLVTSGQQAKE
eukprot:SAG31_NODE_9626_length_1249_cov_1.250435_1_plen_158_part_10